MVFETASAGRNNSHSEQRLYLKSIESSISPHEHPLISNKTRTVQIRELCSPKTVKQKRTASELCSSQLHNWPHGTQLFLKPTRRSSTRITML
ncbi:hypothetical protein AVEN_37387-1 [Araneus ventricosus]|uniref:Uncharacterized protein n=1 Tax=Araneus ventricosus TaxID=182803 RepID=A0A4Y2LG27_ARAVE|nr:hypothetical protein AVEN_37387-1 [Araneus ventricosus]